jgi:hypothetical protein
VERASDSIANNERPANATDGPKKLPAVADSLVFTFLMLAAHRIPELVSMWQQNNRDGYLLGGQQLNLLD